MSYNMVHFSCKVNLLNILSNWCDVNDRFHSCRYISFGQIIKWWRLAIPCFVAAWSMDLTVQCIYVKRVYIIV